jgi:hypothetical protein
MNLCGRGFQHPTVLLAYEMSLRLLISHLARLLKFCCHCLNILSHLQNLTPLLAVDAFLACPCKRAPARAVELLE